jgi:hypothetical protein
VDIRGGCSGILHVLLAGPEIFEIMGALRRDCEIAGGRAVECIMNFIGLGSEEFWSHATRRFS